MDKIKEIREMLDNLFGDEKIKFYHSSDAFTDLAGDTYITYSYYKGDKNRVMISIGGSHLDETPIKICSNAEQIQKIVEAVIN